MGEELGISIYFPLYSEPILEKACMSALPYQRGSLAQDLGFRHVHHGEWLSARLCSEEAKLM